MLPVLFFAAAAVAEEMSSVLFFLLSVVFGVVGVIVVGAIVAILVARSLIDELLLYKTKHVKCFCGQMCAFVANISVKCIAVGIGGDGGGDDMSDLPQTAK